jgi:hypothetical protein
MNVESVFEGMLEVNDMMVKERENRKLRQVNSRLDAGVFGPAQSFGRVPTPGPSVIVPFSKLGVNWIASHSF